MIDRSLIGNVIGMMLALHEGNEETGNLIYKVIINIYI